MKSASTKSRKNVGRVAAPRSSGAQLSRVPRGRGYRRPFVAVTFAMTVDGKITTKNFSPVDFTSREDKLHLFRQRALADAVLVGYTTLQRDNVRLGIPPELCGERLKRGQTPAPIRVIISNKGKIDNQLKIFQSDPAKAGPILIFSTARMPKRIR